MSTLSLFTSMLYTVYKSVDVLCCTITTEGDLRSVVETFGEETSFLLHVTFQLV